MSKQEKELKEVQKYVDAMNGIVSITKEGKYVNFKSIQKDFNVQGMAIQGMLKFGYIKKQSYGKYYWATTEKVTPFMARKVITYVREYFQEKHIERGSIKGKSKDPVIVKTIKVFGITIYSSEIKKVSL